MAPIPPARGESGFFCVITIKDERCTQSLKSPYQSFSKRSASELGTWEEEGKTKRFRPAFRMYDLRHTCATLLLLKGVNPKVVQERLGHASIVLTLNTYSHVLPTMQKGAAEKMEARFGASA